MKEFIQGLYETENFAIYLGAIILVLLVAFFVVFFLGKKDKEKLEKTRKLEVVNDDAFKEVTPNVNVEVPAQREVPTLENQVETPKKEESIEMPDTLEPTFIEMPKEDTPVMPAASEPAVVEVPTVPTFDQIPLPNIEENNNHENYSYITESIENDLQEMENRVASPILNETTEPPISLPTFENVSTEEEKNESNKTTVVNDIFSSVYAPKKEISMFDDTVEIELPRLK